MFDERRTRFHRAAMVATTLAVVLLLGAVALLWAWNTVAVDLFAAPEAAFHHAIAAAFAVVSLSAVAAFSVRLFFGRRHGRIAP